MTIGDMIKSVTERIQSSATVNVVYGEPVVAEGKTIIPVARVRYGFGGGGGRASRSTNEDSDDEATPSQDVGGGGGGGVSVSPVGLIEITAEETRFISFEDRRTLIKAGLFGALVAVFLLRKRLRR